MTDGPSFTERKGYVLARAALREVAKRSGAKFKSSSYNERVDCPFCGAGGFALKSSGKGYDVFNCHGAECSHGNVIDFVMKRDGLTFLQALRSLEQDHGGLASFTPERRAEFERRRAAAEKRAQEDEARRRATKQRRLAATLARMVPLTPDTLAWKYLEDRGLILAKLMPLLRPDTVGFVPDAEHPDDRGDRARPALVLRITKPDDTGALQTVAMQAIFIDPRAQPAPPAFVTMYGGPRPGRSATTRIWRPRGLSAEKIATGSWHGAACRLTEIPSDGHIGAAEGFEKSLAVMQLYGRACWPVMYADNFKTCVFEPDVTALTFYVDNNRPRFNAAGELVDRGGASYTAAKIREANDVRVQSILRPPAGGDFSDLLVAWRAGLVDARGMLKVTRGALNRALSGVA
jgi:hypothetical protein